LRGGSAEQVRCRKFKLLAKPVIRVSPSGDMHAVEQRGEHLELPTELSILVRCMKYQAGLYAFRYGSDYRAELWQE